MLLILAFGSAHCLLLLEVELLLLVHAAGLLLNLQALELLFGHLVSGIVLAGLDQCSVGVVLIHDFAWSVESLLACWYIIIVFEQNLMVQPLFIRDLRGDLLIHVHFFCLRVLDWEIAPIVISIGSRDR